MELDRRCPGCGARRLRAVDLPDSANMLCDGCGTCWRPGDGGLRRVDPLRCLGCSSWRFCLAALAERSP